MELAEPLHHALDARLTVVGGAETAHRRDRHRRVGPRRGEDAAGRRAEAEEICQQLLERDPRDSLALHLLGVMAQAQLRLPVAARKSTVRLLDCEPASGAVALALQEAAGGAPIPRYKTD